MASFPRKKRMSSPPVFKVCLFGEYGMGKTAYLHSLLTGEFEKKYIATLGAEVHPLTFYTTQGPVVLNVWDCAGQDKFGGLREGYYIAADAGICFASPFPKRTGMFVSGFRRESPNAVALAVWGKSDWESMPQYLEGKALPHSTKMKTHYLEPFLQIVRKLMNDPELEFGEAPPVVPPEVGGLPFSKY